MYQSASSFGVLALIAVIVLVWIGPALMTGWLAGERGREPFAWGLLALVFGPLAMVAVGLSPVVTPFVCPACREAVREGARVCPHCRSELPELFRSVADAPSAQEPVPATGPGPVRGPSAPPADTWTPPLEGTIAPAPAGSDAGGATVLPATAQAANWTAVAAGSVPPGWWRVAGSALGDVRPGTRVLFRADSDGLSLLGNDARRVGVLPRGAYILALSEELPGSLLALSQAHVPVVLFER